MVSVWSQVHALKYPVAQPSQATDKQVQILSPPAKPEGQNMATTPPSHSKGLGENSPNSAEEEDDRFFTPHSTRRPQRRTSPSRAAGDETIGQLPKPLSISTLTTAQPSDPDLDVAVHNDRSTALKSANVRLTTTPTRPTNKPSK